MPIFAYTALDTAGKSTTGSIVAAGHAAAMEQVLGLGLHPVKLEERGDGGGAGFSFARNKVAPRDVEGFTRELSNLLAAGVSLTRALHILAKEAASPAARKQWDQIREEVSGGAALADAMAMQAGTFTTIQIAMVRAGEQGGFLHIVLAQIAELRSRERDLMDRVKAAMIYPIILSVLMIGVVVFLLTFFIPLFMKIFSDFGAALPLLTRALLYISAIARQDGLFVLIGVIFVAILFRRAVQTETGRRRLQLILLKTPALGAVISRFALVRFCRLLGTLIGAGVPLVAALRTARDALGNQVLYDAVGYAIEQVQQGESLARSLGQCQSLFPASVAEVIAVAEETGRLDAELQRVAEMNEQELDRRLRMLVSLLEPLLLLVMASLVGTIVVGMLLPVLTMQDLIK
ncbi:MAG: hypothetical protein GC162_01265 [Planctomycetes bacterium]|nr:hypothetical protein [Planctomycetota bacterium]